MEGAQLHLYNVQPEDGGTYRCEAVNSRGKDLHTARVTVEGKGQKVVFNLCNTESLFLGLLFKNNFSLNTTTTVAFKDFTLGIFSLCSFSWVGGAHQKHRDGPSQRVHAVLQSQRNTQATHPLAEERRTSNIPAHYFLLPYIWTIKLKLKILTTPPLKTLSDPLEPGCISRLLQRHRSDRELAL